MSSCSGEFLAVTGLTGSELAPENIAMGNRQMSMVLTWAGILLDPCWSNAWHGLRGSNFTGVIAKITNYKTQQASEDDVNQFVSVLNSWSTFLTRGK